MSVYIIKTKSSLSSPWVDREIEKALQKEEDLWRKNNTQHNNIFTKTLRQSTSSMKINIEQLFKEKINTIWDDPKFKDIDVVNRGYAVSTNIVERSMLFVGINPSYNHQDSARFYYPLHQEDNEYRKYFSKFEQVSEYTNHKWAHIDLLFFRETSQKYIDEIIKNHPAGLDFIWQQLLVSKQILEAIRPKVIIVSNTKARQFLGKDKFEDKDKWLDYDFEFDHDIGTDRIKNKGSVLINTPVFFTSMLTGQRAIDNGSFERLKWHIDKVLKGENSDGSIPSKKPLD